MRAQGLTKVKITQPSESLSYMPIYVGRAKDFFKEAGIDLELVVTRGDGPDVQALMAKEVEFVATPPHHLYTLYLQNRKLLGICGILGRCGINMVITKDAAAERDVSRELAVREEARRAQGADLRRLDAGLADLQHGTLLHPARGPEAAGGRQSRRHRRRDGRAGRHEQQDRQRLDVPIADRRRSRRVAASPHG